MVQIDLIKNHPHFIPDLAKLWHQLLGSIWVPDVTIEMAERKFEEHLNVDTLPLTFIALDDGKPIGMCSLRQTDGIRPELIPWLGSLIVAPEFQKQGIARKLINTVQNKSREFGFKKLYLLTFDLTLPNYYAALGWQKIGMDTLKNHPVTVMEIML